MFEDDRVKLGRKDKGGKTVYIRPKQRATHMHIIGSTGEGKSKFLEHLIREDIKHDRGLCLLDPHGYLYHDLLRWCESKGMLDRGEHSKKIILFDPQETDWTFGFNPLRTGSSGFSFHVDAMVKAVAKVWGGEDTDRTPLLKRCLRVLFHALAEKQLSLCEGRFLVDPQSAEVRRLLTADIKDETIRQQWQYFNALKPRQFYEEFGSTINRLMEFLASPLIRVVIGQTEKAIDFRKIMDEGWILLVNLGSGDKISDDNARLLGTLMVNDLFIQAKGRPQKSRPFYLYIDECARYINEDIGRILDEGRKFGLHLVLAHQHLAQLKKVGEDVYHSVMTDAKTKVIFGGLNTEDARILAENVFLGELDLEEAKESLNKPVVVGYIKTWLESYTRGSSQSTGKSLGLGTGSGFTVKGTSFGIDSRSGFDSEFSGQSSVFTDTEMKGRSQALEGVLEDRPAQVFSLEEQIYRSMALMVNQAQRHAIIKLPKQKVKFVETPFIKAGAARKERISEFKEKSYKLTDYVQPRALAEQAILDRQEALLGGAEVVLRPKEPASFVEPEPADFYEKE